VTELRLIAAVVAFLFVLLCGMSLGYELAMRDRLELSPLLILVCPGSDDGEWT
jgi:hypothetical protein